MYFLAWCETYHLGENKKNIYKETKYKSLSFFPRAVNMWYLDSNLLMKMSSFKSNSLYINRHLKHRNVQ